VAGAVIGALLGLLLLVVLVLLFVRRRRRNAPPKVPSRASVSAPRKHGRVVENDYGSAPVYEVPVSDSRRSSLHGFLHNPIAVPPTADAGHDYEYAPAIGFRLSPYYSTPNKAKRPGNQDDGGLYVEPDERRDSEVFGFGAEPDLQYGWNGPPSRQASSRAHPGQEGYVEIYTHDEPIGALMKSIEGFNSAEA
jgi:hypothetical protein